jgi:hypothetical protein
MLKRTLFTALAASATLAFAASAQAAYLTLGASNTSNAPTTLTGNSAGPELKVVNTNAANQALTAVAGGGSGIAVYGVHTTTAGAGPAIRGDSAATTAGAFSIYGLLSATSPTGATAAVRGENKATNARGYGMWGSQAGSGTGVYGYAPSGIGAYGSTSSGVGVRGQSTSGTGLYGLHSSTLGAAPGVRGQTSSSAFEGAGVAGTAASGTGVLGSSAKELRAGVVGRNSAVTGVGVIGCANYGSNYSSVCSRGGPAGGIGGLFIGAAVNGYPNGSGVEAHGGGAKGTGVFADGALYGVSAFSSSGHAVHGSSFSGDGVYGSSGGAAPIAGVEGHNSGSGDGVLAGSTYGPGLYAYSTNGSAGYFEGPVTVTGTLTKPAGSFRIDHPLDPQNKYLQHSFVESPDMLNVYNGNVTTNKRGFATVRLPRYFQALNRSFRYQLTPLGRQGWDARAGIWRKIRNSRFTIRTDKPRVEVSWQVTGVRHDRYANAHRIQVVVPKSKADQGKYLHPELYGKSKSQAIGHQKQLRLPRRGVER